MDGQQTINTYQTVCFVHKISEFHFEPSFLCQKKSWLHATLYKPEVLSIILKHLYHSVVGKERPQLILKYMW